MVKQVKYKQFIRQEVSKKLKNDLYEEGINDRIKKLVQNFERFLESEKAYKWLKSND